MLKKEDIFLHQIFFYTPKNFCLIFCFFTPKMLLYFQQNFIFVCKPFFGFPTFCTIFIFFTNPGSILIGISIELGSTYYFTPIF